MTEAARLNRKRKIETQIDGGSLLFDSEMLPAAKRHKGHLLLSWDDQQRHMQLDDKQSSLQRRDSGIMAIADDDDDDNGPCDFPSETECVDSDDVFGYMETTAFNDEECHFERLAEKDAEAIVAAAAAVVRGESGFVKAAAIMSAASASGLDKEAAVQVLF